MSRKFKYLLVSLAAASLAGSGPAGPAELLPGPVQAKVLAVIDGDTIAVAARIWLGQDVDIHVRIFGIDAPELNGRCAAEREAARAARALLERLVAGGDVVLTDIRYDKYGGRVLARVAAATGEDVAARLVTARLAHPYDGGKRQNWCS